MYRCMRRFSLPGVVAHCIFAIFNIAQDGFLVSDTDRIARVTLVRGTIY